MTFGVLSQIHACVSERWSASIGDPTAMGWATVMAYFFTTLVCLEASRARPTDRKFWALLFVVLLFLGVNKQLDLQSALTAVGRCIAQYQGWYEDRRQVQLWFIVFLLASSGLVFFYTCVRLIGRLGRVGVALFGFGVLLIFISIRAVGFHHFDAVIGTTFLGIRLNWLLEIGGIFLIATNAVVVALKREQPRQRKSGMDDLP
jgi:hypothetical protein